MRSRRQLLMWTSVILALSLILFDRLRGNPAIAGYRANSTPSDSPQIDLASVLSEPDSLKIDEPSSETPPPDDHSILESNPLKADEKPSEESHPSDQLIDVTREIDGEVTSQSAPRGVSSPVSMQVYSIRKNDTLWEIAKRHNLDMYSLLSINELTDPNLIRQGQSIHIPSQRGILHIVQKHETLEDIALQYDVTLQSVIDANAIEDPDLVYANTKLFIPGAKIPEKLRTNLMHEDITPLKFIMPVQGRISDRFGYRIHPLLHRRMFHKGIDIAGSYGSAVKAAMKGRVRFSGEMGGYGKLVIIEHQNGFETRYAHNSRLKVKKGQIVRQGQTIAFVGNTGRAKGTHLHFEIREDGDAVDPFKYLKH